MTDRVLIAGAGPVGLTMALELSRYGVPVRVIDKIAGPSDTSRARSPSGRAPWSCSIAPA